MKDVEKKVTLEEIVETIRDCGIQKNEDIEAISTLVEIMTKMSTEYNFCLSLSSTSENSTNPKDFDITFKNLNTGDRFDLKLLLMLIGGVKIGCN